MAVTVTPGPVQVDIARRDPSGLCDTWSQSTGRRNAAWKSFARWRSGPCSPISPGNWRVRSSLAAAATESHGAEAPWRRLYGKRHSPHPATQVNSRQRRAAAEFRSMGSRRRAKRAARAAAWPCRSSLARAARPGKQSLGGNEILSGRIWRPTLTCPRTVSLIPAFNSRSHGSELHRTDRRTSCQGRRERISHGEADQRQRIPCHSVGDRCRQVLIHTII